MIAFIFSVILSIASIALSAFAWWINTRENKKLKEENRVLEKSLRKLNQKLLDEYKAESDLDLPIEYMKLPLEKGGVIVYRKATLEGREHYTAIKDFTDPDEDYNRLCAEELIEKLNEE